MSAQPPRAQDAEKLLAKITPGPWAWEWIAEKSNEWAVGQAWRADGTPIEGRIPEGEWMEDTIIERRLVGLNESGHANAFDAEFIAAAPRIVREQLAEITSLRDQLREAQQAREDYRQENIGLHAAWDAQNARAEQAEADLSALRGSFDVAAKRTILRTLHDYAGTENWAKLTEWMVEARQLAERIERDGLRALLSPSAAGTIEAKREGVSLRALILGWCKEWVDR